jgi:hypothetical protein
VTFRRLPESHRPPTRPSTTVGSFALGFWCGMGVDVLIFVVVFSWAESGWDRGPSMSFGQYFWGSMAIGVPSIAVVSSVVLIVRRSTRRAGLGLLISLLMLPFVVFLTVVVSWASQ